MFVYTEQELRHLDALMEDAFLSRHDPSCWDPAYHRHLAEFFDDDQHWSSGFTALDLLERAEALECGMANGGETLP